MSFLYANLTTKEDHILLVELIKINDNNLKETGGSKELWQNKSKEVVLIAE